MGFGGIPAARSMRLTRDPAAEGPAAQCVSRPGETQRGIRSACLALLLLTFVSPAAASQIRSLNLEDLARRADRIVQGRVVEVTAERDVVLGRAVTSTTLRVERSVKGRLQGLITFRSLGARPAGPGRAGSGSQGRGPVRSTAVRGMPEFRPGERIVLFLYADSPLGLTSPVGFGQGKFSIVQDPKGGSLAINAFGNRSLLRGLSEAARRRLGGKTEGWKGRGPIPLENLLDLIEALVDDAGRRPGHSQSKAPAPTGGLRGPP